MAERGDVGDGEEAAAGLSEGCGGPEAGLDHERKLTRAEQLLLWKQRRLGSGGKVSHTSDKQRLLQGLSSSQVNRRTGSGGGTTGKRRVDKMPRPAAPSPMPSRRDSARSLRSVRPRSSPSPSHGGSGAASDDEQAPSSREPSVLCLASGVEPSAAGMQHRSQGTSPLECSGEPVSGGGALQQEASAAPDSRRCSIHVPVEEDDDEVEWRVPVTSHRPRSSQGASPAAQQDQRQSKETEREEEETVQTYESAYLCGRAEPRGQAVEGEGLCAAVEDVCSELASMQDTEEAGAHQGTSAKGKGTTETPEETVAIDSSRVSEKQLFRAAEGCELHLSEVHVSAHSLHHVNASDSSCSHAGGRVWVLQGVEDEADALLPSATPKVQHADKETDRMEVIAETWMEDFEVVLFLRTLLPMLLRTLLLFMLVCWSRQHESIYTYI
jgi:hypothetical protein